MSNPYDQLSDAEAVVALESVIKVRIEQERNERISTSLLELLSKEMAEKLKGSVNSVCRDPNDPSRLFVNLNVPMDYITLKVTI